MTTEDLKLFDDLRDRIKRLESKVKALEGKSKRWKPPTIEEVKSYCKERNNGVEVNTWYNHYTANGWMVGKVKMKDWQASVRTWEKPNEQQVTNAVPDRSIPIDFGTVSETAMTRQEYLKQKQDENRD